MHRTRTLVKNIIERALPLAALLVLLMFSYAWFFRHSYGIAWRTNGTVTSVFVNEREPTLHPGDRLIQVGAIPFSTFTADLRQDLFGSARSGDVLPVIVERNGQQTIVHWLVPGPNAAEMRSELLSQWFLAYIFWLAGTASLVLVRPRDMRWLLLGAFNYITAVGLMTGSGLGLSHLWYSALVLRVAAWLWLPVSLHLHWIFPKPLGTLPRWLVRSAYTACMVAASMQWLQLLPQRLFSALFLAGLLGSLTLLSIHALRQPEMRRDLRTLLFAAALAFLPSALVGLVRALHGPEPRIASLAIFSFPVLPFAYLYAAYRRQLGGMELRVNRAISIYTFLILLGMLVIPLLVFLHGLPLYSPDQPLITSVAVSILVTMLSLWGFPRFQASVEHRMLGIAVPSRELQQRYSAHITSSSSFAELTRLLDQEILPSLLVRQFAFLMRDDGGTRLLLSRGLQEQQIPQAGAIALLTPLIGRHSTRGLLRDKPYSWIRLVLPLRVQDELAGFWLFGRRDPDDTYASTEVPILQLFANQTAIALSNILQSERLRAMYRANINRHENERLSLARDLHDSVLSALAGMLMNSDIHTLPKGFQDGYRALAQRLREIVSDLRPPMLNYGLRPALEELADSLMERSQEAITIEVQIAESGDRYPMEKEQHLYRIVQEACENAVKHSHCQNISISGRLEADCVELSIADDGDGFRLARDSVQLYDLVGHRHFGLAGMLERAAVIHAEIRIDSVPGAGTTIFVRWNPDEARTSVDHGAGDSPA